MRLQRSLVVLALVIAGAAVLCCVWGEGEALGSVSAVKTPGVSPGGGGRAGATKGAPVSPVATPIVVVAMPEGGNEGKVKKATVEVVLPETGAEVGSDNGTTGK